MSGRAVLRGVRVNARPHPGTRNLIGTTLYLAYVGIEGQWIGKLLWPAVVVHGILTVLLARAWFMDLTMPTKTTRTEETTSDE